MQYKILIVEDDEDTADIEAIGLQELGFSVEVVHHGDIAIPKMKEWKPEVVVLDLELPGKNGFQILQEMFLDSELRSTIIIANTIHMDAKDDLGFAYYAHYQRIKNEDPVMLNKMAKDDGSYVDLRVAIANLIGQKYGAVPRVLGEWLQKKDPNSMKWQII
jgi:CheY-like chemotaxis protein